MERIKNKIFFIYFKSFFEKVKMDKYICPFFTFREMILEKKVN